jgi:hypothetical protein
MVLPGGFNLNVCGQGAQANATFQAIQGQKFHLEWQSKFATGTSSAPVDIYILSYIPSASYGCSSFPKLFALAHYSGGQGAVDWVAPSTGAFAIWFWNFGADPISGAYLITTSPVVTVTAFSLAYGTTTRLVSVAAPVESTGFQLPFGNLALIGIGAVVAVVASVLVFSRRKSAASAVPQQTRPGEVRAYRQEAGPSQPSIQTGYVDLDNALKGGIPEKFGVVIVSPSYDERDLLLRKIIDSTLSVGRLAIFISNDMAEAKI